MACLIGVPGLAKTKLVEALGTVLGLDWKRIQFTPDLMPADIIGSEVLEETDDRHRAFRFLKGPVFTQLLMADEINRASPRTQSALLQSMQERQVTVAGARYDLPRALPCAGDPESAGAGRHLSAARSPARPFPVADRCRLSRQGGREAHAARHHLRRGEARRQRVCGPEALIAAQAIVRRLPVGEKVVDSILRLVRAARPEADGAPELRDVIAWGPGPRASQAFMLAARARALIDGRLAPSSDDVVALAGPVLRHRMALNFAARAEGLTVMGVIDRLCQTLL